MSPDITERSVKWAKNPEPSCVEPDPRIILDTNDATADAYLWHSHNSSEGWLQFTGMLMDVTQ